MKLYLIPIFAALSLVSYYIAFAPITKATARASDYTPTNPITATTNLTAEAADLVPDIQVYGLSIQTLELDAFDTKGTTIGLWVNTGNKNFVEVLPSSKLSLLDETSGRNLFEIADSLEANKNDNIIHFQMGSGSDRYENSLGSFIGRGSAISDTTGFAFNVSCKAPPPPTAQELRLKGQLVYAALSGEPTYVKLEVRNMEKLMEGAGTIQHKGELITFSEKTGTMSFVMNGSRQFNPDVTYGEMRGVGFSLDGTTYKDQLMLTDKQLKGKMTLYVQFLDTVTKEVVVDEVFGLGF